jgi:nicotinamide-nucleotide amidase
VTTRPDGPDEATDLCGRIADALVRSDRTAATAESLTGGSICTRLSATEGASEWLKGGVVAYSEDVKYDVLGVDRGPVINASTARQMAIGVARLLGADFSIGTTGVGGPGPAEGHDEGTVFMAVAGPSGVNVREHHFDGDPSEVVEQATLQGLRDLLGAVTGPAIDAEDQFVLDSAAPARPASGPDR